jgi:hypothetical protein
LAKAATEESRKMLGLTDNARILLANPEISLYCPIIRFLADQNKINNKACMAGVYGHSDVYRVVYL